jgi:MFS transporter, PPP family, 3-phenylpropionic acid transporter
MRGAPAGPVVPLQIRDGDVRSTTARSACVGQAESVQSSSSEVIPEATAKAPAAAARPVAVVAPRGSIVRPAIVYALLFGGVGAYVPYIALYLGSRGVDLGTVGILLALFSAVSLIAAPSWGALADGIGEARGPILVAAILSALAAAALAAVATAPLLALAIAWLAASWAGIVPMVDSRVVRYLGGRERFGQARAAGSAAFIVVAFAGGASVTAFGPGAAFALYVPLLAATGVAAWLLLRPPVATGSPAGATASGVRRPRGGLGRAAGMALRGLSPSTIASVLSLPRFGLFFLASVAIWSSHAAFQGFVSLRVAALGGDATLIAATWSIGALIEVPLMLSFPRLAGRIGPERLIVIGAFAFAGRSLVTSLAVSPLEIVAAGAFAGFGFAFVYVGTVTWIAGAVTRSVQATAQGMITGTAVSIGSIMGSIGGGLIGGTWGLPALFAVSAAGYALGGVLVWLAIARVTPRPSSTGGPAGGTIGGAVAIPE